MDLVIFHYHFHSGGVSASIRGGIRALRQSSRRIGSIRLVVGEASDPTALSRELGVEVAVLPPLGYLQPGALSRGRREEESRRLADQLLERFGCGDSLWWVHNHHLGKNLLFTAALLRIACSGAAQKMLLQIHDFPEAGRYENLSLLQRFLSLPPYPLSPNVRYAVLNPRDEEILLQAGIPPPLLFRLENPLPPPLQLFCDPARVKRRLASAFGAEFPGYSPEHPLLLYPVRAIRRKNVLEAGLLARLAAEPVSLAVTLPGLSLREREYSRLVEGAFRRGLIPGLFGIGAALEGAGLEFGQLVGAAGLLLSTSVQEGFGYLFLQTLQWGLPLLARGLDTLSGLRDLFAGRHALFYPAVACILERKQREYSKNLYRRKLRRLAALIPPPARRSLEEEMLRFLDGETVDFSYLPPALQLRVLEQAARCAEQRRCLREANREVLQALSSLLHAGVTPFQSPGTLERRFGAGAYAAHWEAILDSFAREPALESPLDPWAVQNAVRDQFARKENLRLLYD